MDRAGLSRHAHRHHRMEFRRGSDHGRRAGGCRRAGHLGRENVYLANYWAFPNKNSPGYLAFKLYRNADGQGNGFGDVACAAQSADQGRLSCYAATDSRTGDLTLMLINKMPKATLTAPLTLQGVIPIRPGEANHDEDVALRRR